MTKEGPISSQSSTSRGSIVRSTLIVMGGLAASIVIGLIRQRIIAASFGTSAALDAYTAANKLPELLFTLLSGGALAFAYIPVYRQILNRDNPAKSNALFSQVINNILLLTGFLAVLIVLFANILVTESWGIAPHFSPEVQTTTIDLMRILLFSTMIFAVSSILTGTLHAHQHFFLPAIAPSMYSGGIIFGALALAPSFGIFGLAWGAVLGALLHFLVQLPALFKHNVRWRLAFGWKNPDLHRVAVLMAPRVIDLFMARASIDWINANLGSGLGEGRVSALQYAFQLMNTPWTLIGTAIGIAVFPTMAALAAEKDISAQRRALSGALRAILTLALPAAVTLIVLGKPIIGILFEGGEFTAQSTELVYYALQFYAFTLISQSILEVVVRAFAAQQDTLTPLLVSFFTTALNLVLAIWLARPRIEGGLEHGGLALANGIAVGIESLIGLTILHIRWRGVDARRILLHTVKAALASIAMGGAILLFNHLLEPGRLVLLLGGLLIGGLVYIGTALVFGIEEIRSIPAGIIHRSRQSQEKTAGKPR
jgi:putative peptidoglycan lipid II flippase